MKAYEWYDEFRKKAAESLTYRATMREMVITEQIISIMEDLNISRAELANRLKISKAAVSKLLNNGSNITLQRAVSIADALGCDLDFSFKKKTSVSTTQTVKLPSVQSLKVLNCYYNNISVLCSDDYDTKGAGDVSNAA
jgi:transcriptional regulator with XRE-family HTH domain